MADVDSDTTQESSRGGKKKFLGLVVLVVIAALAGLAIKNKAGDNSF